jgi:hypothetical protein
MLCHRVDEADDAGIGGCGDGPASDGHRSTFQVDVNAVEAVGVEDAQHTAHELVTLGVAVQVHRSVGPADTDEHLLPLRL